ncbi:hypothetical protein [Streptomyces xantholiticus]|uniref:hypothetical protein n=1 Tax=Streptomyces xantholiticus TaxID=68285 RepID=UPI001677D230|nr:hypothetical protein [Streptomyces xantholiticus]GGW41327.1 hypothetical protein GCM10010381_27730 [Streptomyces xantholiticus]
MTVIHSPVEGFTGSGPGGLEFKDGRAETDDEKLIRYFRKAGYGVGGDAPAAPEQPEPADPRDYEQPEQVGTRLRDAAVDPRPEDFLPPTNAGEANPHGPLVVAPEIHAAEGPKPIHPGPVTPGDPVAQEQRETALAQAVMVDNADANDAAQAAAESNPQPEEPPTKGAAKATWVDWAVARGASREAAEQATKGDLIAQYGPKEDTPDASV